MRTLGRAPLAPGRFCKRCETPTVRATMLGYIGHEGALGHIAGLSCSSCRELWEAPGTEPVAFGHIDLEGLDPLTWFVGRLRALGCDPRPHPSA